MVAIGNHYGVVYSSEMKPLKTIFRSLLDEDTLPARDDFMSRDIQVDWLPEKATILTGVRRCGKSSLLRQVRSDWLEKGLKLSHVGYINFGDERLSGIQQKDLSLLLEAFDEKCAETPSRDERSLLMLDELHEVKSWELFVNRLLRQKGRAVYLTGSSSKLLGAEIATSMRGRSLSYEVFPFSFDETCRFLKIDQSSQAPKVRAILKNQFTYYLSRGGFPETLKATENTRLRVLQEYFEVLLLRDVVERHGIAQIPAVRFLFTLLFGQIAQLCTQNKLHERMKASGHRVDKTLVSECLKWFEDCFAVFTVPMYSESFSKRSVNPKKVYVIDTGLAAHVNMGVSQNLGRLLENAVYLQMRRRQNPIFYFKTKSGKEVDFLVIEANMSAESASARKRGDLSLTQVCLELDDEDTRKREVSALDEAMGELGLNRSELVTLDTRGEIKVKNGTIQVLPGYEWFSSM